MMRTLPLFPELKSPEWFSPCKHTWAFDERGPDLTRKCKSAIGINHKGMMPVSFGMKRSAVLTYTPEASALYNRLFSKWAGLPIFLDYTDCIGGDGLILQSPNRRTRLYCLDGLDNSELINLEPLPDLKLICRGNVNVTGWQAANRRYGSFAGELPPLLLHVLRCGEWPGFDETLDTLPTIGQQIQRLKSSYREAIFEAFDLGGIQPRSQERHTSFWQGKAATYLETLHQIGGRL